MEHEYQKDTAVLMVLCAVVMAFTLFITCINIGAINVFKKYEIIEEYDLHIKGDYTITIFDQTGEAIIRTDMANLTEVDFDEN